MSMLDRVIDDKSPLQEEIFTINRLLESATREFYAYIRAKKIYREDVVLPIKQLHNTIQSIPLLNIQQSDTPKYANFTEKLNRIFLDLLSKDQTKADKTRIIELEQEFVQQLLDLNQSFTEKTKLSQRDKDQLNQLLVAIEVAFVKFLDKREAQLTPVFNILKEVESRLKKVLEKKNIDDHQLDILSRELAHTRSVLLEYEELNDSSMPALLSLTEAEINVLDAWTRMRDSISDFNEEMRLGIETDQSEIVKASQQSNNLLFVLGMTSLFLAISVSIIIGRTLSKRIHCLFVGIRNLADGDYDYRLNIKGSDEFSFLANSFDSMARKLKNKEQALYEQAHYDSLTGLPNRRKFHQHIDQAMNLAKRNKRLIAVMFIDLDNFKRVNDALGHSVGDKLLADVSNRLTDCLRISDVLGLVHDEPHEMDMFRLGGDEFVILLQDLQEAMDASMIAERILQTLSVPSILNDHEIHISASIGVSIYPTDAQDSDTLIKNADIAMYHAKDSGKNSYQFFSESMNKKVARHTNLESKLRKAIDNNHLEVYYQIQIDSASNNLVKSVESLLRWHDDELGEISPSEFIPIAEDSNLIIPIGDWIFESVCQQIKSWQDNQMDIKVAINVSSIQFNTQNFSRNLFATTKRYNISPSKIILELTESMIMCNSERNIRALHQLKNMGFELSIDDFGTGYSSLSYLKLFPLDELKIDRSFVNDIPNNNDDMAICSAIIAMANKLGLRVVAEGVENVEQKEYLINSGCQLLQGFLFGKPVPVAELDNNRFLKYASVPSKSGSNTLLSRNEQLNIVTDSVLYSMSKRQY